MSEELPKVAPNITHPGRAPVKILFAAIVFGLGGVVAGTYWSTELRAFVARLSGAAQTQSESAKATSGQLWTCGMHPQVIQDHPGECPICHMKLTPLKTDNTPSSSAKPDHGGMSKPSDMSDETVKSEYRKIRYWWDPMLSPPYISDKPGKSPMGMDLIPVYEDEASASISVTIDPAVVQNMGLRVTMAQEAPLRRTIRAVGYLNEAQPAIHDVNLRVSGWIQRLYADTEGMHLEQGDPLFDIYSPELHVAVEELLIARRSRPPIASASDESTRATGNSLYESAVKKLALLGLNQPQVEALTKLDRAPETITFLSPITGHLTEKMVVAGAAVKAGERIMRIVDHSTLWIDAQIFEQQLPFVQIGQKATATIASRPGEVIEGEIIFIHPHVDPMTRTAMVRLAIPNASMSLKPGMYATVRIQSELSGRAVMVPREAVIDSGDRHICFVALAVGRFEARRVTMGSSADDGMVQILDGLVPGESVVVSGQFLLDSESRIREAIQKFLSEKQSMASQISPLAAPPGAATQGDGVFSAYLDISDKLGATQATDTPVDATKLVSSAHTLHGAAIGTAYEALAVNIAKAGEALKDKPINSQRELFKELSARVVELVDKLPPSSAVAGKLYRMHCPMAPGDWLQRTENVANPFYATEMKECGEVTKVIVAKGSADK